MGFSLYGKTANNVELEQTSPEAKEEALHLLDQIEAEVAGVKEDDAPVFELDEETTKHVKVRMNRQILTLIKAFDTRRQLQEEVRANHRNMNRMLTLLVAIVLGFAVTWALTQNLVPHGKTLGPYSFVITVTLDFFLALYAMIKHY